MADGSGDGFSVIAGDLRAAGKRAEKAADELQELKPDVVMTDASAAIPGGSAVITMSDVAFRFRGQLEQWSQAADHYALRLGLAADAYQRGDNAGAQDFMAIRGTT